MNKREQKFIREVWNYYETHGRHNLPWRKIKNPYRVLVSEIMLQQTQAERVIPKYQAFIKRFPNIESLSGVPLKDVLLLWQGLGHNRRARYLQLAAIAVMTEHKGKFPRTYEQLLSLPGVGRYTAAAIMNFAYNRAMPLIETNVRTVYLYHFFKDKKEVTDTELLALVERTMDGARAREWFSALMDYGTFLKQANRSINKKSAHYTKQSIFKGSGREIRGAILRLLVSESSTITSKQLYLLLKDHESTRVHNELKKLVSEELVIMSRGKYSV